MYKNEKFKADDLILCDFQYQIIHRDTNCFKIGERVFLKSNPEVPMNVHSIDEYTQKVICDHDGDLLPFKPECILQYEYSIFMIGKRKFPVCLN